MSPSLTYLVTGANRGIGKGFVSTLLQRPNTTIIAGVRDVARSTSTLESLPKAPGSKLVIVKIDSSAESKHNIISVDIVIANAGIAQSGNTVANTTFEALRDHFAVNTIASKSGNPIFLVISTLVGSIGSQAELAGFSEIFSPYVASKAAVNWAVARLHLEETWATAYVAHPGLVLTEMGNAMGPEEQLNAMGGISVEESVNGILSTLDKADRNISGTFQQYNGTTLPW